MTFMTLNGPIIMSFTEFVNRGTGLQHTFSCSISSGCLLKQLTINCSKAFLEIVNLCSAQLP